MHIDCRVFEGAEFESDINFMITSKGGCPMKGEFAKISSFS